jgi:hypothetical protein
VIRSYEPGDLPSLHDVCVRTADAGGDARHVYPDQDLMPTIFLAPYVALDPSPVSVQTPTDQMLELPHQPKGSGGARKFYDRRGFHVIEVPDAGELTYSGRPTS